MSVSCRSQLTFMATTEDKHFHMKKVDPIRNSVLDNHPLGIALISLTGVR